MRTAPPPPPPPQPTPWSPAREDERFHKIIQTLRKKEVTSDAKTGQAETKQGNYEAKSNITSGV